MGDFTDVDVDTLEDFHTNLGHRRTQIETVINKMNEHLKDKPPALGTFQHANESKDVYATHYGEFADRINRLMEAVVAAEIATKTIIGNYRTTEALNTMSAAAVAGNLDGMNDALADGGS